MKKIKIPTNFDAKHLLTNFPDSTNKITPDELNYIVYLLYTKMETDKGLLQGYTFLNAEILKTKIRNYNIVLNYLKEVGVIDKIRPFKIGEYSKSYKLSEKYLTGSKNIEIPQSTFVKKQNATKKKVQTRMKTKPDSTIEKIPSVSIIDNPYYKHLAKWFNKKLTINSIGAKKWIEENLDKTDKYYDIKKSKSEIQVMKIIENDTRKLILDGYGARVYSIFTEIKKEIKNFLMYSNKTLKGLDIKSSLPYMLGLLLSNKNNTEIIKRVMKIIERYRKVKRKDNEPPITLHNLIESVDPVELQRYLKLVCENGIYEHFAKKLTADNPTYLITVKVYNEKYKLPTTLKFLLESKPLKDIDMDKYNIKAAKSLFVRIISGKTTDEHYFKVFKQEFPTISNFLEQLKDIGGASNRHKCSSQVLQRIESYLVQEVITKEFVEENNQPVYSIHDNMITTIDNYEMLKTKATEVFLRHCSLAPKFNEEVFNELSKAA